jgi:DNA-binding response OmpR family regulator
MSRILVVDNQLTVQRIWADLLRRGGHEVHTAGSVAEARGRVDAERFDVVVLDLDLPDGSGHDLLLELRGRAGAPPVIAVSELSSEMEVRSVLEAGFSRHLSKPVRLAELQSAVRAVEPSLTLPRGATLTLSA